MSTFRYIAITRFLLKTEFKSRIKASVQSKYCTAVLGKMQLRVTVPYKF
jgi:hypothetical protein